MGQINTTTILTPVKITDSNEGGHAVIDIKDYQGNCDFQLFAKSDAGSSPTLDIKLQESDISQSDLSYESTDSAFNEDVQLNTSTTNAKLAASFTTTSTMELASVDLRLKNDGVLSWKNETLTVTIEGDSSGPDGSAEGTATATIGNTNDVYSYVTFTFDTPLSLSTSTKYWIVLSASNSNYGLMWECQSGLTSGGNQALYDSGTTTWTADADDSFIFSLYEYDFSDVSNGAFSQVTTSGSIENKTLRIDALKRYVRAHSTVTGSSSPAFYAGLSMTGFIES